jgi:hypothetical protein
MLSRQFPPGLLKVSLANVSGTSAFGSAVRRQSSQREEAGRICTLEAVAQLFRELGESEGEVRRLEQYLDRFIVALDGVKPSVRGMPAERVDACAHAAERSPESRC